jgi:hypothetical protein
MPASHSATCGTHLISPEQINLPEIVAEVRALFDRYEAALLRDDRAELGSWFWEHDQVLRYGIAEHGVGAAGVRASRAAMQAVHPQRRLRGTVITTFGGDCASVCTEFVAPGSAMLGRQTQTWVRLEQGWRIVAAHVSLVDPSVVKRY